jgi:PTS system D-glucosamine-specific IIC component
MLPIAILPVAGILLGLGSVFTNETTLETYHLAGAFGEGTILWGVNTIFKIASGNSRQFNCRDESESTSSTATHCFD